MATTIEQHGQRLYLVGLPFAAKDRAKSALSLTGKNWDGDRRMWWCGTAKRAAALALVAELNAAPAAPADDRPGDDARVKAKVKYKGRTYFVVAESADRCRLTTLDGSVHFWAEKAACELVRTYAPREYRGRTEFTTLGGLRRFVEGQRKAEERGEAACPVCGLRGREMVHDLETGMTCCRGCADMPAD
jgi:hypothetical protein